jgi:hypothetical protein
VEQKIGNGKMDMTVELEGVLAKGKVASGRSGSGSKLPINYPVVFLLVKLLSLFRDERRLVGDKLDRLITG